MLVSRPLARGALAFCLLIAFAAPAVAQPSLSSLWPIDAESSWEFDVRVEGPFDEVRSGILRQTVAGQVGSPPSGSAWCFDTAWKELPVSLAKAPEDLSPLEQHPLLAQGVVGALSMLLFSPPCGVSAGVLAEDESALGIWNAATQSWEWLWIEANSSPGSSFHLPIRTQLVDDAYVDGDVRTIEGAVTVPAGSYTNAVIVDYVVAVGESQISNQDGEVLGTVAFEVVGWVAFVPGVGPVASEENFAPAQIDCPACPPAVFETITTSMELRSSSEVRVERRSFASVKARF